ncbi:MAG: transglycosylase SLT domain-containing protein [Oscillospiraceae bacterium]
MHQDSLNKHKNYTIETQRRTCSKKKLQNKYSIVFMLLFFIFIASVVAIHNNAQQLECRDRESKQLIADELDKPCAFAQTPKAKTIYYDIPLENKYQKLVFDLCEKYSAPPEIVFGVMRIESNFDFMALSADCKCVGIMQINLCNMERLNKELGVTDLRDPEQNIKSGIYMLAELYSKYGDWHKALVCYNRGEHGAKNLLTSTYSIKVMDYSARLETLNSKFVD